MRKDDQLFEYLQNPKAMILKKFMAEFLYTKYYEYEDLLSRLGTQLITESDINRFGSMINEIYQLGYAKAVDDYKSELAKMGIQVNVKTTEKNLDENR